LAVFFVAFYLAGSLLFMVQSFFHNRGGERKAAWSTAKEVSSSVFGGPQKLEMKAIGAELGHLLFAVDIRDADPKSMRLEGWKTLKEIPSHSIYGLVENQNTPEAIFESQEFKDKVLVILTESGTSWIEVTLADREEP